MKTNPYNRPCLHYALLFFAIFIVQISFGQEKNNPSTAEYASNKKIAAKTNLLLTVNNSASLNAKATADQTATPCYEKGEILPPLGNNNSAGTSSNSFKSLPAKARNSIVIYVESDASKAIDVIVIDEHGNIVKQKNISNFERPNKFSSDEPGNLLTVNYQGIIRKKGDIYSSTFNIK